MSRKNPKEEGRRSALIALFCLTSDRLSGYGVRQCIKEWRMEEYLSTSPATIYRSLVRLKKQGYLTSRKVQRGRYPPSTEYEITAKGREHYAELIKETALFKRSAYTISPMLGLGSRMPRAERIQLARLWMKEAAELASALDARLKDKRPGETYGKPYAEWLMLSHEHAQLKAECAWIRQYIKMLKTGAA